MPGHPPGWPAIGVLGAASVGLCPSPPAGQDGRMQRIGLTGGIAAGKAAAARRLGELGAVVIASDVLAREAVAPGSAGLDAVVEEFGAGVLGADASLDRAALAGIVF